MLNPFKGAIQKQYHRYSSSKLSKRTVKLEGTLRVQSHTDNWLCHLANVNEACTKHPWNCRRLVTPHSECRWYTKLTYWSCDLDLLTPKACHFKYIPRSFPIPSVNILGSFVFESRCGQTDKQTVLNVLPTPTNRVVVSNEQVFRDDLKPDSMLEFKLSPALQTVPCQSSRDSNQTLAELYCRSWNDKVATFS